jgi:pyridoxal phosphate enzyme (YggS family)
LLVATKYADAPTLDALLAAGVREVGENRVQQLLEHYDQFARVGARVHFIGSLQTNKVKYIVDKVAMIHSIDSLRLAAEVEKQAAKIDRVIDVLVEINAAREESKSGAMPEDAEALCRAILQMPHLRLCGFMTMGSVLESEAAYREYFAGVRAFGTALWQKLSLEGDPLFSMGMSQSFAAAIEAGADMVRVGRGLFAKADVPQ